MAGAQEFEERTARIATLTEQHTREDNILQTATAELNEKKVPSQAVHSHLRPNPAQLW